MYIYIYIYIYIHARDLEVLLYVLVVVAQADVEDALPAQPAREGRKAPSWRQDRDARGEGAAWRPGA